MVFPVLQGTGMNLEVALQNCPNPKCNFPIYSRLAPIINKLNLDIRKHIIKYYNVSAVDLLINDLFGLRRIYVYFCISICLST